MLKFSQLSEGVPQFNILQQRHNQKYPDFTNECSGGIMPTDKNATSFWVLEFCPRCLLLKTGHCKTKTEILLSHLNFQLSLVSFNYGQFEMID